MDQPKIARILRLIALLSDNRVYTIDELAVKLETSQRTIYRYIDTFKEANFVIEKVGDYKYRLVSMGRGVKDLRNIVYFTPEEAFIVNRLIDSLDPSNSLKNELRKKLATVYDKTSMTDFSNVPTSAQKIEIISAAIKEKKVLHIVGYTSSYSGKTEDHLVEPFEFTPNFAGIWAYDLADGINKRFKILRMEAVKKLEDKWTMALAHHATPMDAFRVHGDFEYHVVLRLNNVAKNLMVEEYPLTEPDIVPQTFLAETAFTELRQILLLPEHDMEDEEEDFWIYDGMVRGLDGVGRFVLGLEGNIEVMEGDELIAYLKEHADHIHETYDDPE